MTGMAFRTCRREVLRLRAAELADPSASCRHTSRNRGYIVSHGMVYGAGIFVASEVVYGCCAEAAMKVVLRNLTSNRSCRALGHRAFE